MKIQDYLAANDVPFTLQSHPATYDAKHLAHALHVTGRHVAKSVLLRANHGYVYLLAVLPATHRVDLQRLSSALGGAAVELATEGEVAQRCPDCEPGVLPPFGSKYALKTIVDESLVSDGEIVLEGNTHDEAIRMNYRDYFELEHPLVASFAVPGS